MPAPTTADEILDLVQKSGLVDEGKLRPYVQKLRDSNALPADPTKLAQVLVRDAMLTYFQAEQLLQGKYKRFSLGKYKVLEKLGAGGMGTVFLCEHKLMRRRVAVKVLPVAKSADKASLDRFLREARAVAAVDHPNIVRAYDIDQDDNLHFLVMEWVDGTNLQDLVKKFGPLDVLRACHYIYGSAVGLQHGHEAGLIHRDIKPGNILVDRSGVVKILDLGLARLTNDTDDNLTRQNDENVLGTADYLAPEQAMDSHTVDIRADVYSLGATFYFLLTGSPPFPDGSVAQKLIWHQNRQPRPLRQLRPDVPDDVAAVVERMMAKDPDRRYQTPADVMAALAARVSTPIPPPAEREMPTLAPAVSGSRGAGAAPFPGPTSAARAGAPTLVAPTVINPARGTDPDPGDGQPAVWSDLDYETQTAARGDTDRPGPAADDPLDEKDRPSRVGRGKGGKGKGVGLLLALVGGAVLLGAVAAVVYFAFVHKKNPDTGPGHAQPVSRKVTVSKGGGGTVGTLREALLKAGPGDVIAIADPRLAEPPLRLDKTQHKNVTIESALPDGKPAVIEFAGTGGTMLDASNVEGFHLRNLEFDGKGAKGQAEIGIQINGVAAGATLEAVTVRGVQKTGIHLWNLAGTVERPVTLDRVRVVLAPGAEACVLSYATGELNNKFVAIKNSRFEGPARFGLRFDGPALEVEVTNNRFYNFPGGAGVSFFRPLGRSSRVGLTGNTFYEMQLGVQFDCSPDEAKPYAVKVAQNYFAKTALLLAAHPPAAQPPAVPVPVVPPELKATNNLHDPASAPGTPPLPGATKLDAPTLPGPNPNPNDDGNFLRFVPPNTQPTAGGVRVGAN